MLRQEYSGRAWYYPDHSVGPFELLLAVPCRLGDSSDRVDALLDTAAEWCVISTRAAEMAGYPIDTRCRQSLMSTRFGTLQGTIERIPLTIPADEGEHLTLEATWFVSPDWAGPVVLGWRGLLERIRFAVDPDAQKFYFAGL